MRKITEQVVGAFLRGENKKVRNTESRNRTLLLYGNEIARLYVTGIVEISNAGWATNTTRERLNAIPGVHITQKDWQWYLNGKRWNGEWVAVTNIYAVA